VKSTVSKAQSFFFEYDKKPLPKPVRWIFKTAEFFYLWHKEVTRDFCLQKAASLTYTTLLAIFPLIAVLSLFVPIMLGGVGNMEDKVVEFVESRIIPQAGQDIESNIRGYFEVFRRNATAVGLFGVAGLMISAMLLFSNVEKSFNEIWQARRHRNIVAIFSRFTAILVCAPILIGASIFLSAEMSRRVFFLGRMFTLLVPYLMSCMALTLAYFILPNTKVKIKYALIGGVAAGLIWELAKVGFGYYVANPKITVLYKSAGAVPIFLIWTYFTWLIVFLGCEMSFLLQNYERLRRESFQRRAYTTMDSRLIFLVYMIIGDFFQRGGGGVNFFWLLRRMPIRASEMEKVLKLLVNAGFVAETVDGQFIPTKPLDKTKPADILSLGCKPEDLLFKESENDVSIVNALKNIEETYFRWLADKTVEDLISRIGKAEEKEV